MDSSSPENLFDDRNKVLQGLIRGRESVNQLRLILEKPLGNDKSSVAVDDLVTKILGSFTESISMLNWRPIKEVFDKIPANTGGNSPSSNGRKYDESEESSKSTSAFKERRGCYKRRCLSFSFHFFFFFTFCWFYKWFLDFSQGWGYFGLLKSEKDCFSCYPPFTFVPQSQFCPYSIQELQEELDLNGALFLYPLFGI